MALATARLRIPAARRKRLAAIANSRRVKALPPRPGLPPSLRSARYLDMRQLRSRFLFTTRATPLTYSMPRSRRSRRGMALLATVLLTILAATIVLAIATQAVLSSKNESIRSDASQATRAALDAQHSIESQLQADPYFYFKTISPLERARICNPAKTSSGTTIAPTNIQPGSSWPLATCGTSWGYTRPTTLGTIDGASVEVDIIPPSSAAPTLGVRIFATYGNDSDGLNLTYRINGSERFTVYSSSDLDINPLTSLGGSSLLGTTYTGGTMFLPSPVALTPTSSPPYTPPLTGNSQLEAESGFSPAPPAASPARYYSTTTIPAGGSSAQVRSIRNVTPEKLTTDSLRSSATRIHNLACPGGSPNLYASQAPTSLCLVADGSTAYPYVDNAAHSGSGTTTIPSNTTAYMMIFAGDASPPSGINAANTVDIYATTDTLLPPGGCLVACDLTRVAATDAATGNFPGRFGYWSPKFLGTFVIPQSGVIYADHTVYLSQCSSALSPTPFLSPGTACPALSNGSSGTAGMVVGASTTVLAGTPSSPADIYISGPISTAPGVSFGAVASRSILIPYWSRAPALVAATPPPFTTITATNLSVSGAYTALGYGIPPATAAIQTFPSSVDTTNAHNLATQLTFTGSLAAPSINLGFNMFGQVSLSGSTQLSSQSPPYFTDFDGRWSNVASARYTAAQACAAANQTVGRTCSNY